MKTTKIGLILFTSIFSISCNEQIFPTNGETIYKTGKNLSGEKVLDKSNSRIKIVNSCKTCHGKTGDRLNRVSIKFSYLSNPNKLSVPYTDSLFFRFLDHDLRSDGSKANIGVVWKMNSKDKRDLLEYLKTL